MKRPADQLEQFRLSDKVQSDKVQFLEGAKIISVTSQNAGDILNDIILEYSRRKLGQVLSAKDKLLDHNLNRQRFSLRFLSLVVLPSTFLVGIIIPDEKIRTSCFGMVSLIVGALIQESGSQRNPRIEEEDVE